MTIGPIPPSQKISTQTSSSPSSAQEKKELNQLSRNFISAIQTFNALVKSALEKKSSVQSAEFEQKLSDAVVELAKVADQAKKV